MALATSAFKQGRLTVDQRDVITGCADSFTRALSVANKYRELTGKSLALDDLPSPAALRQCMEQGTFAEALAEAARIQARMQALFQSARQRLEALGFRLVL